MRSGWDHAAFAIAFKELATETTIWTSFAKKVRMGLTNQPNAILLGVWLQSCKIEYEVSDTVAKGALHRSKSL